VFSAAEILTGDNSQVDETDRCPCDGNQERDEQEGMCYVEHGVLRRSPPARTQPQSTAITSISSSII